MIRMMKVLLITCTVLLSFASVLAEKPTVVHSVKNKELSPVLKRLNRYMHASLKGSIKHQRQDVGPLIIFEKGKMKLLRANQEVAAFSVIPPLGYHQLKVIGHLAFVTVIQLQRTDVTQNEQVKWIHMVRQDIEAAKVELQTWPFSKPLIESQSLILGHTLKLLDQAEVKPVSQADLERYSETVVPLMSLALHKSAQLHLDVIHAQTKRLYALLEVNERLIVRVHLYGGRGARRDNIVTQYFSWVFGERTGLESGRIVFSENIFDHDKALDMFAKYSTERQLGQLIFKEPTRLDRDLLGDKVRAILSGYPDSSTELKGMSTVK